MSGHTQDTTARRPPGRPRSERSHRAILQATLGLLVEVGYARLTMEQVQRRAGVGKATIYRRWASKEALVAAAIQDLSADLPVPDTGSLIEDYRVVARAIQAAAASRDATLLMPRLLVEAGHDPELHAIFTEKLVDPRRRIVRTVLQRARDRGEIRADVELELVIDMLVGPIVYRFMITEGDLGPAAATASRVLEILLEGLRPPAPGR